ncbi:MAG: transposase [Phycisphaerales bacterium]|nr:MAG: transposase [Phycisphaerales bacterium]
MRPLTNRQSTLLRFVVEYLGERGFPPTLREIGDGTGLANISAVRGHVMALEKKGYITKDADKARSIRVLRVPSAFSMLKRQLHEFARTDEGVLHKIVYGVALATRKRREQFLGQRKRWIAEALEQRAVEHGWKFLRKKIEPDHIVLVVGIWPNHSPDLVVSQIRQTVNKVRSRHAEHFQGKSLWAKGYVATTDLGCLDEMVSQLLQEAHSTQDED